MSVRSFLTTLIVTSIGHWIGCEQFSLLPSSDHSISHGSRWKLARVPLSRTPFEPNDSDLRTLLLDNDDDDDAMPKGGAATTRQQSINIMKRERRDVNTALAKRQTINNNVHYGDSSNDISESRFQEDEVGWSNINAEVDIIVPMIMKHLQKLNIEYLQLPSLRETISVTPLFINYEVGLHLSNGIVYGLKGIRRFGDAFMTYTPDKSFLCRFHIVIKKLQFEYDFLIKLMAIEGYGRVIGSLADTIIFGELGISVIDTRLQLHDFRVTSFGNIQVQLDQHRIIRELSGAILSPITNLFRDRITTSISDGLKEQIQLVMDDFNDKDPLQLKTFAKQILAGLTKE